LYPLLYLMSNGCDGKPGGWAVFQLCCPGNRIADVVSFFDTQLDLQESVGPSGMRR
jgi:hypothetical protein